MRYIDADELKKFFPDDGEGNWTYNVTAKSYIDSQPTTDVVPKEKYDKLLKNATILADAVQKYEKMFESKEEGKEGWDGDYYLEDC